MSGAWVPYHLRWNKSIDRSIFIEFLTKLNAYQPVQNYSYIGFGAVHMEDFKIVHSLLGINDLKCLEQDTYIHKRQKFNRPLACIELCNQSSGEFISDFFPERNSIVWLDYADPRQIGTQIREFQALLSKLQVYDVVKITLNANPNALVNQTEVRPRTTIDKEKMYQDRFNKLKSRMSGIMPQTINADMMTNTGLPIAINQIIEYSSKQILDGKTNRRFFPVNSFVYADSNHQMLTFTGVILEHNQEDSFIERTGLNNWEYFLRDINEPHKIDIPDLTLRERMEIDSLLPCDDLERISSRLLTSNVQFDENKEKSMSKLESYMKYYRHSPFFTKISV
ncbi:O-methyltransferase [Paenibacillus arenilitoris]|uniref:Uncharacterized protein n=1 Tax=Paenibacillus arenilitoris TaxID=2772299 RepID=A0A927CUC6_9BACL|nr:O-methyltransferase [Paenibacillus arenilitoris]MBD2871720.1 hypothetical protein [Paenibacillus arenilitoris]